MKKLIIIGNLFVFMLAPAAALALNLGADNGPASVRDAAVEAGYSAETSATTFAETVGMVIKAAMAFLGIIFTALLVYAGFYWMMARGEEEKVTKAKGTIRMAIIGLIIVVAAYSISNFVMKAVLGG